MDNSQGTIRLDNGKLPVPVPTPSGQITSVIPIVKVAAKTDMGKVRENNEDKYEMYEPDEPGVLGFRGSLYAVSDGMGGAAAGQIASEQALDKLIEHYYHHNKTEFPDGQVLKIEEVLKNAISFANGTVRHFALKKLEWKGMGATLTGIALVRDRAYIAHVGDSRAYLIRDERITQMTNDHTWVDEQVRMGRMTAQEAAISPHRNILTRSMGTQDKVLSDIESEPIRKGDIWVLCTDGLTGYVGDDEIRRVALNEEPAQAVCQLIKMAKERGGRDNITVLIAHIREFAPFAY